MNIITSYQRWKGKLFILKVSKYLSPTETIQLLKEYNRQFNLLEKSINNYPKE